MANDPHRVLLITTGGTIAGEVASNLQDDAMKRKAEEFSDIISGAVHYLNEKHGIDISVETFELANVDSSDVQPEIWVELAATVKARFDDFESFIITHGTNTLGYTCAALSFALINPAKPIILTGSQVAAGLPGSDGVTNLENALRVATWPRAKNPIKGVLAVFGSHIISGTRVKKDTEFDYDAFKSFSTASVGRIGRIINISEPNLAKHVSYLSTGLWPEARTAEALRCENDFDMRIASITEFPGMSSKIFESLVERDDIQGFVLRAFGAGDPATRHRAAFEKLKAQKIPLVITTQAPNGNSNFQVNEPGEYLRKNQLAIPAFDMSIEAQTTKLGWLLAKKTRGEITYENLCEQMVNDIRGEINVLWEVGV
ncbi:MAG TPA: asparaginase [Solirubrobacteraceae bacterium]|nr:asparaginase [Solirubrobacteraceae bacterium]